MQLAKITYFLVAERLGALDVRVLPIPGRAPTETIVLGQKAVLAGNTSQNGDDLPPLISWLHGGPHATTTTAFNAQITGLALEGCTSNFLFFILLYTRKFAAVQLTVGGGGEQIRCRFQTTRARLGLGVQVYLRLSGTVGRSMSAIVSRQRGM